MRLILNQIIEVTEQTGLNGYLLGSVQFQSSNISTLLPIDIKYYMGNKANPTYPQVSGGSFIKIANQANRAR